MRRLGLRARLTMSIGLLFVVAGLLLLGVTYALVDRELSNDPAFNLVGVPEAEAPSAGEPWLRATDPEGNVYVGDEAIAQLEGQQEEVRTEAARTVLTQGALALVVVGGLAVTFVWLVSGSILAPLRRVTETARRISAAPAADLGLHERIAITGRNDEVQDLASSFDTMLERLGEAFAVQRRFIANASHELRTPLTVSRALIEIALQDADASPRLRKLGADLMQINQRHERLIDGLMLLAKAEHELADRSLVDLADLVEHVVAQSPPGDVRVETELEEAATRGEALLLERMVHNLLENARRYNQPDGWVRVACGPAGRWVELQVANTGPVVPAHEVPGLFRPFRRLGADRIVAEGAGLGLSIVASIARAHGGEATAQARPGGGLVVTVRLPAAEPAP